MGELVKASIAHPDDEPRLSTGVCKVEGENQSYKLTFDLKCVLPAPIQVLKK